MGHHRQFEQCADLQYRCADGTSANGMNGFVGSANPAFCEQPTSAVGRLLLDGEDVQIRLANESWRAKSNKLVERRYSWRGYKAAAVEGSSRRPESLTIQACSGEEVFGTLNVGFDSQTGLACDALYKAEIDAFRIQGAVAAEYTRLAVEPEYGSKELLGALFHVAYLFASTLGRATDMFIEVNPRHVPFYKRI